jgi:Ribbon-helix-helix protein, copG family
MRLNTRLPEELARKLEALKRATGQSTSNVVRIAIERYFTEICGSGRSARETIYRTSLVGCGGADADFSAAYKSRMGEGLTHKHGHR